MPIKRLQQRLPSFPRIGELRKGAERTEDDVRKKRPGRDLKWFRFTPQPGETQAAERFRAAYGDHPTEINVYLPYARAMENFEAWQEEWVQGGLIHRCDGETCVLWLRPDGSYSQTPRPCPGGCKQVGRLRVLIPELKRMAYVTVLTSSVHDILNLTEQLQAVEGTVRLLGGDLRGVPFVLRRRPRQVSMPRVEPGSGRVTRVRAEKWLLSIEPHPDWVQRLVDGLQRVALPDQAAPLALAAPNGQEEERDEDIGTLPDDLAPPADDFGADEPEDEAAETGELPDPELARDAPPLAEPPTPTDELAEWVATVRARVAELDHPRKLESATDKQLGYLRGLIDEAVGREGRDALARALFDCPLDRLTFGQASVLIDVATETVGDRRVLRPEFAGRARRLAALAIGQAALI